VGSRGWRFRRRRASKEMFVIDIIGPPPNPLTTSLLGTVHLLWAHSFLPALTPASPSEPTGNWDSIHVFETVERGRQAHYKLTSTIMLQLVTRRESVEANLDLKDSAWKHDGEISLSGSMTRQVCIAVCGCNVWPNLYPIDGTRPSRAGWNITCTKCWEDG
jgi:hypothetical protein